MGNLLTHLTAGEILKHEYVRCYDLVSEYEQDRENDYIAPWASYTKENQRTDYNKKKTEDLLTFDVISSGTIYWKAHSTAYTATIQYKKNDGEWTSITSNTGVSAPHISVNAGDVIRFKGDNVCYSSGQSRENGFSAATTVKFEARGNIMSLIDSTGFATATTLVSSYTFNRLFYGCYGLTSAENLILPATSLSDYCYYYMFGSCSNMEVAPELPSTVLTTACYTGMFQGCAKITECPKLPATGLTMSCYANMFQNCTSLTTAPELPATTLAGYCYQYMFSGCRSLTVAPELPATTLAGYCYQYMFSGCGLTVAPELPATTLATYCYSDMFRGCSGLTTAPELPATALSSYCYRYMFSGCTSLNYIKCLATNIPTSNCTTGWVSGVASSGTFVKPASMTSWTTGTNGIPSGWSVQDV